LKVHKEEEKFEDEDSELEETTEAPKRREIESALAQGVDRAWEFLLNKAKKLKKNNIPTIGVLLNDPLERRDIKNILYLYPHQNGWITKEASQWWKDFAPVLQSEYANKKLRKVLDKLQRKMGFGGGDW